MTTHDPFKAFPLGLDLSYSPAPITDRRDYLNYTGDNTIQGARYIDPTTADFQQSSNNHFVGQNYVEQEILLALSTTFNSSVVSNFGQNFLSSPVITPYVNKQMNRLLNDALSYLIYSNLVVISGNPTISANAYGQVSISFCYINNSLSTTAQISYALAP